MKAQLLPCRPVKWPGRPSAKQIGPWAPSVVAVLCVAAMFVAAHATFFSPAVPMNPKDEGYITAFSVRMLEGRFLPYVDAVSHRGPVLYFVAALAAAVGDRTSFVPIRTLALLCSLLMVGLPFLSACRVQRPLAGALAAIGTLVACVLEMIPDDGLAYNGETLLDAFALGALTCLTFGLTARSRKAAWWTAAAGALAALGALSKQVGVVTVVALAIWPAAAAIARSPGESRLRRWSPLWAFAAGVAAPVLLVVARYAVAGALRELYFYTVTYNSRVYMAPVAGEVLHRYRVWLSDHAAMATAAVALVALALGRALAAVRAQGFWQCVDRQGFVVTVALGALLSGAAANATTRGFPHYFVQAIPWFSLLVGVVFEDGLLLPDASTSRRLVVHLGVLVPTLAFVVCLYLPRLESYRKDADHHTMTLPICAFVEEHSKPSDPIYVWGFAPDIYTYCHRRPASRFVYSTFQSGYVPFFDQATRAEERQRVVPGTPEQFLGDLERSKAQLVLDAPFTMSQRKIDDTPAYAAYLADHYCLPVTYDKVRVFQRLGPPGGCPRE